MDGKPVTLPEAAFRVYRVRRQTHPATKYEPRAEAPGRAQRVGLARAISKMGYCSRAQAAELIAADRVQLNGAVRRSAEAPVLLGQDKIEVDGREIRAAEKAYWMLNKPRGVVTTASDEKGRQTIYDFIDERGGWLAPVGRLDKASEGLLLLTNDSQWAARVLDPAGHVAKTYHVQIAALADLHEGKNRQIRRMLEALGVEVLRLVRVAMGELELGDLAKGKSRKLSVAEKAAVESWKRMR